MLKIIVVFLFSLSCFSSEITFYWGGIASVSVTDGTTTILFDPAFHRPTPLDIILNSKFDIDPSKTKKILDRINIKKADAIFIAHTHHDHYADAPIISQLTGAKIYGSKTSKMLSLSSGVPENKTEIITLEKKYQIGEFTVTPLEGEHGMLLNLFDFLPGELHQKVSFPIRLWNYKMGGGFSYLLTYKNNHFLIHETSHISKSSKDYLRKNNIKTHAIFQGIVNRLSTKDLDDNLWKITNPLFVIPIHHDNFIRGTDFKKIELLPLSVNFDEFRSYMSKIPIKLIEPEYFKPIVFTLK